MTILVQFCCIEVFVCFVENFDLERNLSDFSGAEEADFPGLMEYGRPLLEEIIPYCCNGILLIHLFPILLAFQ